MADRPVSPTDIVTPEDVRDELNFIEGLRARLSGTDEYMEALLSVQRTQLLMQAQQSSVMATPPGAEDIQPFKQQNLPIDAVGVSNRIIYENDTGPATFQIQGTIFATEVRAREDIPEGAPVRVTGSGNEVNLTANVPDGLVGISEAGFSGVSPDAVIDIQNQTYTQQSGRVQPVVNQVSFTGDLDPGDEEVVVSATVQDDNYRIVAQEQGVSAHKADVDNDNTDESIIRYHYQYKEEPGDAWEELAGSPTTLARGDLADPQSIGGSGIVVGPVAGYRVVFENRTDTTASSFTVDDEALGAIFKGRLTQT